MGRSGDGDSCARQFDDGVATMGDEGDNYGEITVLKLQKRWLEDECGARDMSRYKVE